MIFVILVRDRKMWRYRLPQTTCSYAAAWALVLFRIRPTPKGSLWNKYGQIKSLLSPLMQGARAVRWPGTVMSRKYLTDQAALQKSSLSLWSVDSRFSTPGNGSSVLGSYPLVADSDPCASGFVHDVSISFLPTAPGVSPRSSPEDMT